MDSECLMKEFLNLGVRESLERYFFYWRALKISLVGMIENGLKKEEICTLNFEYLAY